jgi:O-antigen/teichoic acid export membrane protein
MDPLLPRWPFVRHIEQTFLAQPHYRRFLRGVFWVLIGSLIAQGLTLLASFPLARLLGTVQYGELGVIQSTLAVFAIFAGPTLGLTATRHVAQLRNTNPRGAGRIAALSLLVSLAMAVLLVVIVWIAAPRVAASALNSPSLAFELRLACLALFFTVINAAQTGVLAGLEAFNLIALTNLVRGLASFPLLLLGAYLGGLPGTIIALGLITLINAIVLQVVIHRGMRAADLSLHWRDSFQEWRVLTDFSLPAMLGGMVVVPVTWFANLVIVHEPGGYVQMGIFNAANQWRTAILFLPTILSQPVLPVLSELYSTRQNRAYMNILRLDLLATSIISGGLALFASLGAVGIMRLYGKDFAGNELVLVLLSLSAVFTALAGVGGSVISSLGKMWAGFLLNLLWAGLFCLLVLGLQRGADGLAMAYLGSYVVHLLTVLVYVLVILRVMGIVGGKSQS